MGRDRGIDVASDQPETVGQLERFQRSGRLASTTLPRSTLTLRAKRNLDRCRQRNPGRLTWNRRTANCIAEYVTGKRQRLDQDGSIETGRMGRFDSN
jgi:hypothetical protein